MPSVSIIMNCRNCATYLREALDSVYDQTFKDYEIIFWDNLSTDNSGEIALSYGNPIKYFLGDEPLPLSMARNAAIEKASGDLIAFLDCDDVWLTTKLEKQVALFNTDPNLGLVYSDCLLIDENGDLKTDERYNVTKVTGNVFDELFQGNFIPMSTAVISMRALDNVGIFLPGFEILEEYDLWLRIADKYSVGFVDEPLAKYRRHSLNISRDKPLGVDEGFRIVDYWADKKPDYRKWCKWKIKQRKTLLHIKILRYYLAKGQRTSAIREIVKLIALLPFSIISMSKALKGARL